jgi:hypothetical protein
MQLQRKDNNRTQIILLLMQSVSNQPPFQPVLSLYSGGHLLPLVCSTWAAHLPLGLPRFGFLGEFNLYISFGHLISGCCSRHPLMLLCYLFEFYVITCRTSTVLKCWSLNILEIPRQNYILSQRQKFNKIASALWCISWTAHSGKNTDTEYVGHHHVTKCKRSPARRSLKGKAKKRAKFCTSLLTLLQFKWQTHS